MAQSRGARRVLCQQGEAGACHHSHWHCRGLPHRYRSPPLARSAVPPTRTRMAAARASTPLSPESCRSAVTPTPFTVSSSRDYATLDPTDTRPLAAPTTWSELANPELVDNVSNRERTRQEILYALKSILSRTKRFTDELAVVQVGGRRKRGEVSQPPSGRRRALADLQHP